MSNDRENFGRTCELIDPSLRLELPQTVVGNRNVADTQRICQVSKRVGNERIGSAVCLLRLVTMKDKDVIAMISQSYCVQVRSARIIGLRCKDEVVVACQSKKHGL